MTHNKKKSDIGLLIVLFLVPPETLRNILSCLLQQLQLLRGKEGDIEQVMSDNMRKLVDSFGMDFVREYILDILLAYYDSVDTVCQRDDPKDRGGR